MIEDKNFEYYKNLSLHNLKDKILDIKAQLPKEERNIITFSNNFTLSLSNYCQNQCKYCFYHFKIPKKNDNDKIVLIANKSIKNLVQKATEFDCKEALVMSGERPDIFRTVKEELTIRKYKDYIEFVIDICKYLLKFNLLPHTNLGTLTYNELKKLKEYNASMGLMLESTKEDLHYLGGVHEFSPGKYPKSRLEHITNAGKLKIPFTTGILLGIGENFEDRYKDLILIKQIYEQYGHIQEVIIQNFVYKEGISYKPDNPIKIKEILKTVGIAKILFQNEIAVQVAPNLIAGYEKEFIEMGINDFGGISPITKDFINPENPWPEIDNLKKICLEKDYILKERLPIYDKYLKKNEFVSDSIKKILNFKS